jgi:hypothetical protein
MVHLLRNQHLDLSTRAVFIVMCRPRLLELLCYGWYLDYAVYGGQWYNVDALKNTGRSSSGDQWFIEQTPREGEAVNMQARCPCA